MRTVTTLGVILLCLGAPLARAADSKPAPLAATTLKELLTDYEAYLKRIDPVAAGQRGDLVALARWPDNSPEAIAENIRLLKAMQAQLVALAGAKLTDEEALNRDLLRERVELDLAGFAFDEERIPFNNGDGFFTVPNYAADGVVLRSEPQARAWLARMAAVPAYYATETANMRRGLQTGLVRPRLVVERDAKALQSRAAAPPERNALLKPINALPAAMPEALRTNLQAEALEIVKSKIQPAEKALADFFQNEYLPRASATIGIGDQPDGAKFYRYLIRRHTSTTLSPEEIHQIGLGEVARIREEMLAIMAELGFKGTIADFVAQLRADKRFIAASTEEYVEKVRDLAKRADAKLPGFFRTLPRLTYGVRVLAPELKDSSSGYNPGSPEQGVAGFILVNPGPVEQSPLYGMPAWALHEGVPGHHLQIALAQERTELPIFRRHSDINAYVEGWALYSERLGIEMGMYRTPYENFGRLSLEIWRACRLVIDTGMHVMGWTRDQAVAYLRENTALSDSFLNYEVDRYIGWPAQALGYKLGEIRIRQLRARAEKDLGPKFDLRSFHDALLLPGPMPLDLLERQIDRWIKASK
ncbi:hypothetical protein AYO41_00305 [Verrucomicrobia bacterium SCGC AG-212-E04]|nr:hypothetical protein AYO41_00305 [Verrucomicrobia bacterium SCGC AG-212-E04]